MTLIIVLYVCFLCPIWIYGVKRTNGSNLPIYMYKDHYQSICALRIQADL